MSASFEYALFNMRDPTGAAELSDMVVRFCMENEDGAEEVISHLVSALHAMRVIEATQEAEDDEDFEIPIVADVEEEFRFAYDKASSPSDRGDCVWADYEWGIGCPWHKEEVHRLARLTAGSNEATRRQMRAILAKDEKHHNEEDD